MIFTFYNRLGVAENATPEEIKRAYRKKAIELHPDKNGNSAASKEDFIKVQRAYECLSDENRRRSYDARLREYRLQMFREQMSREISREDIMSKCKSAERQQSSVLPILLLMVMGLLTSVFVNYCDDDNRVSDTMVEASEGFTPIKEVEKYEEYFYDNGDMPYSDYWGTGAFDASSLSYLKVDNYSGLDAVVLLVNKYSGRVIRNVYVKAMSSYKINRIPEGMYSMKVMYGNSWNVDKYNGESFPRGGFMKNVSYSSTRDNEEFDFFFERDYDGVNYPTWEVTLHKVKNGNMKTKNISNRDFFE